MNEDREREVRAIKAAYDLSTLMRALPWIFLTGDKRGPQALTQMAFENARSFLESHLADPTRDRHALMRGLALNWFQCMGLNIDPATLEAVVRMVSSLVDGLIDAQYDPGLTGDIA